MTDQLQDLLQQVYEEGVAKAKAEAERLIAQATQQADSIKARAAAEAEAIVAEAQKKAADLGRNTDSDLKMAADHTISSVKQKIVDLILDKAINEQLKNDFADPEFMKKLILQTLEAWKQQGGGSITIGAAMQEKLDGQFLGSLKNVLGGELKVDFSPLMKSGFTIAPLDGSYKLSFTDEDFANLFKSYLRPRTAKALFQS